MTGHDAANDYLHAEEILAQIEANAEELSCGDTELLMGAADHLRAGDMLDAWDTLCDLNRVPWMRHHTFCRIDDLIPMDTITYILEILEPIGDDREDFGADL